MLSEPFQVSARSGSSASHRVVQVTGRLQLDTVPQFLKAVRAETAPVVIFDFTGVSYIDSSGVGSLIQTFASMKRDARQMALAGLTDRALEVLRLTRVEKLLPLFPTAADAEAKFAQARAQTA